MILHALHDLYERLEADDEYDVAPEGFSIVPISFVIRLKPDGQAEIIDYRQGTGNQRRGVPLRVPGPKNHTNKILPFLLRDTSTYLLGIKEEDPKPENTRKRFEASRDLHLSLESEITSGPFSAVCNFFRSWDPAKFEGDPKILANSGVFQMRGSTSFVHEDPSFEAWLVRQQEQAEADSDQQLECLITQVHAPASLTHTPPLGGGIPGAQTAATIVSFNFPASESFARDQGENAPVSKEAATRYCKSLNALLSSSKHRIRIGDATAVLWTEKETALESVLKSLWSGGEDAPEEDESGSQSQATTLLASLKDSLRSLKQGGKPTPEFQSEEKKSFYILGLTGQAGGRIGIRFWHRDSVGGLLEKLAQHHRDLDIVPQWGPDSKHPDPEFPAIWMLLRQTARESKDIPPTLSGALMRSILEGAPYPEALARAVISRIRSDREVNYFRAAILKAWLLRLPNHNHNIPMTYDPDKPDPAYRLGALFALLEKTQQDALGDINAGIRDRFYSSASATPASVFPRLMRTYGHHLSKASSGNKGYQIYREREVQSVLGEPEPMDEFPAHLNLRDQGLFAIGYYHKRKDLWTKKDDPDSEEPDPEKLPQPELI